MVVAAGLFTRCSERDRCGVFPRAPRAAVARVGAAAMARRPGPSRRPSAPTGQHLQRRHVSAVDTNRSAPPPSLPPQSFAWADGEPGPQPSDFVRAAPQRASAQRAAARRPLPLTPSSCAAGAARELRKAPRRCGGRAVVNRRLVAPQPPPPTSYRAGRPPRIPPRSRVNREFL
ncbi:hypothetical protein I4F81_000412 [Pyropia yezoensis]|uniref:Uncharacterized protein n=1 Tax=Pyropia yezoensis TaxID=2788 RepID=A0ACC3BJ13_PYRYE|nr:hypothetical protein I4F81_000412 [Neopyropia yezoensis]